MYSNFDDRITILGRTNWRNQGKLFGIRQADRRHHLYIIGKTGTGKSTLLETMSRQDIASGHGLAVLDPHGDLVERLVAAVPESRRGDLIYFNVPDVGNPLGFNPLERVDPERRGLAAAGLLEVFKKLWGDSWGPRLEHILRNSLLALLDQPEATLADVQRLLDDVRYRKRAIDRVANPYVRRFWLEEYESYPARLRAEAIAPVQNKVGAFVTDPVLQRIVTQTRSSFHLRAVMDEGHILLVNLAKGKIGEDASNLLGSLLVSSLGIAALSRADVAEGARQDFYVFLDEFQNFTTLSIATMLSELRKYRVSLTMAHQHLTQLNEEIRDAVLGNAGTVIAFRVGATDAEELEAEFEPELRASDLGAPPNYNFNIKLMINGVVSRPFSASTPRPLSGNRID